jgi:methionine-rich copper-binding protein CopC
MHIRSRMTAVTMGIATLAMSTTVSAHTRVTASTPAEGANVKSPSVVTLTFSEALLPPTVATSIVMTAMPGMSNHGEMVIRNFTPSWSNGNRTLKLTLRKPLKAGSYDLRWQAAGADGHRMKGKISFTVS